MLNKIKILFRSLYGYILKGAYDLHILRIPSLGERESADCIVSLTSYGRRVQKGVVCYSIYSILRQTLLPKRIILWLSETEWNDTNLPHKVAALRDKGVEIRYCADMKSYKKLLPTFTLCPDEPIITIDDDVIYPKALVAQLWQTHKQNPSDIIGTHVYAPKEKQPYNEWSDAVSGTSMMTHFAVGVGGILYPAHCLPTPMMKYPVAQKYAPMADDVWFWAASIVTHTVKRKTAWQFKAVSFDAVYQALHKGSALQHSNVKGSELTNDMQLAATLNYIKEQYGIS